MFGPDQAQRLKRAVKSDSSLSVFEGQPVSSRIVLKTNPPPQSEEQDVPAGMLYPPAALIGMPFDRSCLDGIGAWQVTAPQPTLAAVRNAQIIGSRSVIGENGELFSPQAIGNAANLERILQENDNGYDGYALERGHDGDVRCYFGSRPKPRHIPMSALFLHNLEPGNFGSFMFRQLPKMFHIKDVGVDVDCYVTGSRTSWFSEAMDMLSLPKRPVFVVREICGEIFDKVYIQNDFDAEGFMTPETNRGFAFLRDHATQWKPGPEKLYVSRALSGVGRRDYRLMDNELEVEAVMRARGFEIVYPEALTFQEQINVFHSARYIVGPSGSAMFNSAFAPRGARIVDIETYHNTVRQHAKFYSSQHHVYAFAFADFDPGDTRHPIIRRSNLPLKRLDQALEWLLAG